MTNVILLAAFIATLVFIAITQPSRTHAQIGQAPIGGHQIGGAVSTPHEATPAQSLAHSQDQRVEPGQGYTALPQLLLSQTLTADQMTPDERLRSAVEFCEMDFAKSPGWHPLNKNSAMVTGDAKVTEKPEHADYSSNPDCIKVMKVWADSGAKERYEQEVAAWRASQLDREKQLISRVAREAK